MVSNLAVNIDNFVPCIKTNDDMLWDIIITQINKYVPKSKYKKELDQGFNRLLLVDQNYYEKIISIIKDYLGSINKVQNISWINKVGVTIPGGYSSVGYATLEKDKNCSLKSNPKELCEYKEHMKQDLDKDVIFLYDKLNNSYTILVNDRNYETGLIDFNKFVLQHGLGPFETIYSTSLHGKILSKINPNSHSQLMKSM